MKPRRHKTTRPKHGKALRLLGDVISEEPAISANAHS
jgi:hypothetical protein